MALLNSELQRIRYELGFPVVETAAEPYIGVAAVFKTVIQPYLSSGAVTSSSSPVSAQSAPTPTIIVLASVAGIEVGQTLVVDVGDRQERTVCTNIQNRSVTCSLGLAHSSTYPVTVEGGESIVRDILRSLRVVEQRIAAASSRAGVKKVDEIEFFGAAAGMSAVMSALASEREYLRGELSRVLFGIGGINGRYSHGSGSTFENY